MEFTWLYLFSLLSLTVIGRQSQVTGCTEDSITSRYDHCFNSFISSFYVPQSNLTDTPTTCSQAKTNGVDCIASLVRDCGSQVASLSKIFDVIVIEKAFQYACDSLNDVSLGIRCYNTINNSQQLQSCEQGERQALQLQQNVVTSPSLEWSICLSLDTQSSCLASVMGSVCRDQSLGFTSFVSLFFPTDCSSSEGSSGQCGDDQVMTNFTKCVKPFFESIEKLNLEKEKCNDSALEVLKCVQKVVAKCAPTQRFRYIQKLLDLQRTRTALNYGCEHIWELASGAFCYNKHYGSDIKPCLDKSTALQRRSSSDNQVSFEDVCKYIDATTDCARDGMETCKNEAVTFSQYVRMFFPDDCTDDISGSSHATAIVTITVVTVLLGQSILRFTGL